MRPAQARAPCCGASYTGLSPAIRDGWVQVWALDPKGGMELGLGRGAFARFEGGSPEAMCDLLEEAVDLKTRRSLDLATHGKRVHQPSAESPHLVIVIDELATLSAFAERTVVRRIEHALGLLLTQGRAVGITVIAAVQDPGKDVVSWRDLFPTRIAMRLDNPIQVDMVLGDGARERGAQADHISELTPGVAYVRIEGSRDVRRVRSAYLTDEDVLALSTSLSDVRGRRARHTTSTMRGTGKRHERQRHSGTQGRVPSVRHPAGVRANNGSRHQGARWHPLASARPVRQRQERRLVHGPADAGGSDCPFGLLPRARFGPGACPQRSCTARSTASGAGSTRNSGLLSMAACSAERRCVRSSRPRSPRPVMRDLDEAV